MLPFRKRVVDGIHFLELSGDPVTRAKQHALLLKDEIQRGTVPVLARYNQEMIKRALLFDRSSWPMKWITHGILNFYDHLLVPFLSLMSLTREDQQILKTMAEISGISYRDYNKAFFQTDGFTYIARASVMKYLFGDLHPLVNCSSAVAFKSWSADGKFRVARNLDYMMVGPWEPETTVISHNPTKGSTEIPHWCVTSAGVHTAGLTGINAEGITIAIHSHFTRSIVPWGKSAHTIGDQLIGYSKTIAEVIERAKKMTPMVNWAFVVTSAKENRSVVLEATASGLRISEPEKDWVVHTNQYHTQDLQKREALACGAVRDDVEGRLNRMRYLLGQIKGRGTRKDLMKIIGDPVDSVTGEERVLGNVLSVVTSVQSVVMEPEDRLLWVSTRKESPTGWGPYVGFSLDRFWQESDETFAETIKQETLEEMFKDRQPLVQAMRTYREAYKIWQVDPLTSDTRERTFAKLKEAVEIYPTDGNLWIQVGLMAFSLCHFSEAERALVRALEQKLSPHTQELAYLFLGRCFDLRGDRSKALTYYQIVNEKRIEEPRLRKALQQGLKKPYRSSKAAQALKLDLQFPDAMEY